jgi:hypothetical protein
MNSPSQNNFYGGANFSHAYIIMHQYFYLQVKMQKTSK